MCNRAFSETHGEHGEFTAPYTEFENPGPTLLPTAFNSKNLQQPSIC